jgi:hypothetical protein
MRKANNFTIYYFNKLVTITMGKIALNLGSLPFFQDRL